MISNVFRCLAVLVVLCALASCGGNKTPPESGEAALSGALSAPGNKAPAVRELLEHYMPEQMTDGIVKVAIVRNLAIGDHTRQFLEGCVAEGRAMGFTVDTFITGGDNNRCREFIARIGQADYDGLILSHGDADFTYNALKPAVDKKMKVVTFDALPYKDGDPNQAILPGVTSTAQDDVKLAQLSWEAISTIFSLLTTIISR